MNSVVRECLEQADAFGTVVMTSMSRRLSRPTDNHILAVPLVECIPILGVPGIVERLHELQISLLVSH
jgi:hypothetical protein